MTDPTNDFNLNALLTDQEWDTLEDFLDAQQEFTPFTTLSALDGFITAVVSGPEIIPPADWLPEVFGGDMEDPTWKCKASPEEIIALLLRMYNHTATLLAETPQYFSPLFLSHRDEENIGSEESDIETQDIIVVDEWCYGYLQGFMITGHVWEDHDEAFDEYIRPIILFGDEEGREILEKFSKEEQQEIKDALPSIAVSIYDYWLNIRAQTLSTEDLQFAEEDLPAQSYIYQCSTVGRDDPCSCGSGKKYKQCCGLN